MPRKSKNRLLRNPRMSDSVVMLDGQTRKERYDLSLEQVRDYVLQDVLRITREEGVEFVTFAQLIKAVKNARVAQLVDASVGQLAEPLELEANPITTFLLKEEQELFKKGDPVRVVNPVTFDQVDFVASANQVGKNVFVESKDIARRFPAGSFVFLNPTGVNLGIIAGLSAIQIFAQSQSIGVLTDAVDGEVDQLPVNLWGFLSAWDTINLFPEVIPSNYTGGKITQKHATVRSVGGATRYDTGLQNLPIIKQNLRLPEGTFFGLNGVTLSSRFHVDPGKIQGGVERVQKGQGVATIDGDYNAGTQYNSIVLTGITTSVNVRDGEILTIRNKESQEEDVKAAGGQFLTGTGTYDGGKDATGELEITLGTQVGLHPYIEIIYQGITFTKESELNSSSPEEAIASWIAYAINEFATSVPLRAELVQGNFRRVKLTSTVEPKSAGNTDVSIRIVGELDPWVIPLKDGQDASGASGNSTLTIEPKVFTNSYAKGVSWLLGKDKRLYGELLIQAGRASLIVSNLSENLSQTAGLRIDVTEHGTSIAELFTNVSLNTDNIQAESDARIVLTSRVTDNENGISSNASAIITANTRITDAENNITGNSNSIVNLNSETAIINADLSNTIRSATAPQYRNSGQPVKIGDSWTDTSDEDRAYIYDGTSPYAVSGWKKGNRLIDTNASAIMSANSNIGNLQTDSNHVFRQTTFPQYRPSGEVVKKGDNLVRTDQKNRMYSYDGTSPYSSAGWIKNDTLIDENAQASLELNTRVTTNEDGISNVKATAVLKVDANGNIASIALEATHDGTTINIKGDQVKVNNWEFIKSHDGTATGHGILRSTTQINENDAIRLNGTTGIAEFWNIKLWGRDNEDDFVNSPLLTSAFGSVDMSGSGQKFIVSWGVNTIVTSTDTVEIRHFRNGTELGKSTANAKTGSPNETTYSGGTSSDKLHAVVSLIVGSNAVHSITTRDMPVSI